MARRVAELAKSRLESGSAHTLFICSTHEVERPREGSSLSVWRLAHSPALRVPRHTDLGFATRDAEGPRPDRELGALPYCYYTTQHCTSVTQRATGVMANATTTGTRNVSMAL